MIRPAVLITGIAGGIGQAIASVFSRHEWEVWGLDLQPQPHACVDRYYQVDLADPSQIDRMVDSLYADALPHLNALIHNAGFQVCSTAYDTSLEDWDRVMAINVRAPFLLTQKLYPLLRATKGSVVNVASVHALATSASIAAYATSKGALVALTRAQAIDFAADGVRVNAVLPGAIDTPMLDAGSTRGQLGTCDLATQKQNLASRTVSGKIGIPLDIGEAVFFLADIQRTSFITGQTLVVDGGALARLSTE